MDAMPANYFAVHNCVSPSKCGIVLGRYCTYLLEEEESPDDDLFGSVQKYNIISSQCA